MVARKRNLEPIIHERAGKIDYRCRVNGQRTKSGGGATLYQKGLAPPGVLAKR